MADPLEAYRRLLPALQKLHEDGGALPPLTSAQLALCAAGEPPPSSGLTRREREVADWMLAGKSNPAIAVILGISPRTVDKHRQNLYAKLGVGNRIELLRHWHGG